jgi:LuxR family maltose regulon positive regulatory protein
MENYAVAIAEYEEVLALWQQDVQHSQFIRLEALIRLAVVQRHLLMNEEAHRNFTTALREAAMDDVLLPFVEDARHVLPLLLEVRKRDGVPDAFLSRVIASCREQKEKAVNFAVPEKERPLTSREHEILKLASEGLTQKQIAEKLDIKVVTVKKHLISVYAKLGVSGKVAAIRLARVRKIL